ncbi:tetratricopeptide repeat protein [Aquimonas sp.]|jgi:serine/threonine-protein kinase|uniref:tetratricopeptide repeat protein n=1 Tax=Aquimonas sp. TaxID=1872588 RepID=UPI0037BEE13C
MSPPPDRRAEIDALFVQALDLEDAERAAFVQGIADPFLHGELVELLRWAEAPDDPFQLNAAAAERLLDQAFDQLKPVFGDLDEDTLPEQIGAWRIMGELGAGGMGRVLLVERSGGDFEQRGALKLIRHGIAASEFARRFVQERQILARLDHPCIARLLDGGRDPGGRLYLVMEYVDGEPIDRYCDRHRLGIGARVELFLQVCAAVAHAHRNLVIHRDLKPSNIVVSADGSVKLLDFGIAKVLDDSEAGAAMATRAEMRMFTPEYASPEQVRGEPVTTASDVYQLGLLLYELLTGHRAQAVGQATPAGLERAICNTEPPRPSQRLAETDSAQAEARQLRVATLRRSLRGDLDNIVLKAIRKAPERRYASVPELIEDLQRSRAGHTVRARPDTWAYRARTFLRRHPIGVAFAFITALLLLFYAVTLTLQAQALAVERDRAQAEARKAREVQGFVQRLFEGIDPDIAGAPPLSVKALLDRSWGEIEGELGAHPEVQAELLDTVGNVYRALGDYDRAGELLGSAQALAEKFEGSQPLLAARIYRSYGITLGAGADLELAERQLRRALQIQRSQMAEYDVTSADTMVELAYLLRRRGNQLDAERFAREALDIRIATHGEQDRTVAESLNQLATIERLAGRLESADTLATRALEVRRAVLPPTHPQIAENLSDLAMIKRRRGDIKLALTLYAESIEGQRKARGSRHPFLAATLGNYGKALGQANRLVEAEAALREALSIQQSVHGAVHASVAFVQFDLGKVLFSQGRFDAAVSAYTQALTALPHSHDWWRPLMLKGLAACELARGQEHAAQSLYRQALKALRDESRNPNEIVEVRLRLVEISIQLQQLDSAEIELREVLEELTNRGAAAPKLHAETLRLLGTVLIEGGSIGAAIPHLEQSLQLMQTLPQADAVAIQSVKALLAQAREAR